MSDFTNIVIVQPGGLSDTILSTPVAAALKAACPPANVTWLGPSYLKDLLIAVCPSIDDAIEIDADETQGEQDSLIQSLRPDLVVNLSRQHSDSSFLQQLAQLFSMGRPHYKEVRYEPSGAVDRHLVDRYLDTLAEVGIEHNAERFPTIFPEAMKEKTVMPLLQSLSLNPGEPIVGIVPSVGAEFTTRNWLSDGWCYLVRSIKENTGAHCLLLGGANDVAACSEVATQLEGDCIDLSGKLTLPETAGLLKALALVIGGDCGAIHMAVAADTPVIGLYGPTRSAERGPYKHESLVVDQSNRCECPGEPMCQKIISGPGNCMRAIMLNEVMDRVYTVLDSTSPPSPVRDSSNWFWSAKREQAASS